MQYHYKVKDLMTPDPVMIDPNASLKEAAEKMLALRLRRSSGWNAGLPDRHDYRPRHHHPRRGHGEKIQLTTKVSEAHDRKSAFC